MDMEQVCIVCGQPILSCGRANRRASSFKIIMTANYMEHMVSSLDHQFSFLFFILPLNLITPFHGIG
jgi:hypothetical protein